MNFLRCAGSVLLAVGLLACGGGGAPDTSVKVSTLLLTLVDGTESVVSDTTPTLIYQSGSVGVNQSTVKFKLVNSNNDSVAGS